MLKDDVVWIQVMAAVLESVLFLISECSQLEYQTYQQPAIRYTLRYTVYFFWRFFFSFTEPISWFPVFTCSHSVGLSCYNFWLNPTTSLQTEILLNITASNPASNSSCSHVAVASRKRASGELEPSSFFCALSTLTCYNLTTPCYSWKWQNSFLLFRFVKCQWQRTFKQTDV